MEVVCRLVLTPKRVITKGGVFDHELDTLAEVQSMSGNTFSKAFWFV